MVQKSPVNINTKFSILNFVFKSYLNYGKYQKAIDFCNENIKILINYCKKEELASLNNDLGLAFSNLAKNKKSIELYNLSLKLDIDDINPSKAVSYYRMANAYYFIDNFKEAELNIYKSLTLLKDIAVPEHLANAYLVEAMIMVKLNSANIDKAIEKCHKSLELYRSIYADNQNKDENNICFANAFYCLGNFWWKKSKEESRKNFEKSLEIMKTLSLKSHILYAKVLNKLGSYDFEINQSQKKEYLEKALKILSKISNKDHPLLIIVKQNIKSISNS